MPTLEKIFTSDSYLARYEVELHQDGMRLDQFMAVFMPTFSREEIKRRIDAGDIKIENRPTSVKPSSKVYKGNVVAFVIKRTVHEDEIWRGEKLPLVEIPQIVFEDDDLIVISKPPFMATHPAGKHLFNCATVHFEQIHKKTIHSIHRLDRETSGILLLGKNSKSSQEISKLFEDDLVKKCYFFIAQATMLYNGQDEFWARERLSSAETGPERVIVKAHSEDSSEGKESSTFFKILHKEQHYLIGLAFPETGRQHQIRVHAQSHGFPLVGDKLYLGGYPMFQRFKDGVATDEDHNLMQIPRHALHALAIKIKTKKEERFFQTPLPLDFIEWIKDHLRVDPKLIEKLVSDEIKIKWS